MNGTAQKERRKRGTTRGRLTKTAVAAGIASLAPTALNTVPAEGTIVNVDPAHNITVFANIDFVATFGHDELDNLTVEVRRNGVVIGTATGQVSPGPAAPEIGLEVNHGPEGAPVAGDCWEGHTPDIRPGDRIRVTRAVRHGHRHRGRHRLHQARPRALRNGDIVVPFRAYRANGRAIAPSFIDSAEFRAEANNSVRFEGRRAVRVERRPGAKPGQLWQRYPSPFRPARNDDENPFNQAELRRALLRDGHATGFGHVEVLPREAMLHRRTDRHSRPGDRLLRGLGPVGGGQCLAQERSLAPTGPACSGPPGARSTPRASTSGWSTGTRENPCASSRSAPRSTATAGTCPSGRVSSGPSTVASASRACTP